MTPRDDIPSLHAYNRWADARVLDALRPLSHDQYARHPAPGWPPIRSTLVHAAGALQIWSDRLNGATVTKRPSEADFPTLADAEYLLLNAHDAFARLAADLTPDRLAAPWTYHNLRGEPCTLPLWTVHRHVVNHATYHRGQIASKLHLLGFEPPVTDLVFWAIEESARP